MTLQRVLLLGLTVLCVGLQNTEGLDEPYHSGQLQNSNDAPHDNDMPTTEGYDSQQWPTEEPPALKEDRSETVKDNSEEASTTIETLIDQESNMEGPRHIQTLTMASNATPSPDAPINVRIVVAGRSGYGVSSTIRELIGNVNFTKCEKPEGEETLQNIYEYTISDIPGTNSSIKLLDLPGFVDGRTLEKEAQILATLKSYISNASDGQPPDFFLALSGFDDNRYVGVHSLFVQFLKRLELFEHEFLRKVSGRNMNIVFLLTKMMSETRANQRRPSNKINNFRNVIRDYTRFPPPYQIVVGDNHAYSEHNAPVEDGYYRLPNKEHYPKNIWEAMINSSTSDEDVTRESQVRAVLNAMKENRETEMKCTGELIRTEWGEYKADADAFLYLLHHLKNLTIEENGVNQKIQQVFEDYPRTPDQMNVLIQKTALQLNLQHENITNEKDDIPETHADKAEFFQKSSVISSTYAALLLADSFGLEMAEYIQPLTVGKGYDTMADELAFETPFMNVKSLPSPIGYRIPNFMNCKRFPIHDTQTFQSYVQNMPEYCTERLKHLKFTTKENINVTSFTGRAKAGYNIAPEEGVDIATLTAAKEIRTLKCVLAGKESWGELNEEFVDTIRPLEPVNVKNRDSVREWTQFFGKYGTHIVVQGYGGGRLVGSIVGPNVKRVFESNDQSVIDNTMNSILKFSPFSVDELEKPSYQLFAGEIGGGNANINKLHDLPEDQRDKLLRGWEKSLDSNFEMLSHEFTLERISIVIKEKIGESTGAMVDMAIDLALKGGLKYQKRQRPSTSIKNGENRRTTKQSFQPSTTTTTTTHKSIDRFLGESQATDDAYQNTGNGPSPTVAIATTTSTPSPYNPGFYPGIYNQDSNTADTYYADIRKRMREQREREAAAAQERLDNFKRINQEAQMRHEQVIKGLQEGSETQMDKKYKKECTGVKKVYLRCWSMYHFENYLIATGSLLYREEVRSEETAKWNKKQRETSRTKN